MIIRPCRYLHQHRWDDDVVFRNQARGTDNKGKKEFVNVGIIELPLANSDVLAPGFTSVRLPQTIHGKHYARTRIQMNMKAHWAKSKYVR